jgi:hypothetical protein
MCIEEAKNAEMDTFASEYLDVVHPVVALSTFFAIDLSVPFWVFLVFGQRRKVVPSY